jgi:dTDP-glucose pyrophosphorylase
LVTGGAGFIGNDPERYGVFAFDAQGRATSLEKKPAKDQKAGSLEKAETFQ